MNESPFSVKNAERGNSTFQWSQSSETHKMFGKARMPDQPVDLELTLEELCHSHSIQRTITRTVEDEFQRSSVQRLPVTIQVKAGWKAGTKITFEGYGDETFLRDAANVIFIVKEIPHPSFSRSGNDLSITVTISLEEALQGGVVEFIDILTGNKKKAQYNPLASSSSVLRVPNFGMPILNSQNGARGQLVIRFNVVFNS